MTKKSPEMHARFQACAWYESCDSGHVLVLILVSLAVGCVVGLLGGGGSILAMPAFLLLGFGTHRAIASSLALVFAASAAGLLKRAADGRSSPASDMKLAALMAALGSLGAVAGAHLSHRIPELWLHLGFAIVLLLSAKRMFKGRAEIFEENAQPIWQDAWRCNQLAAAALAIGLLSGMVGAGGGFLVVPALTQLARISIVRAIGISLWVLLVQSAVGFSVHIRSLEGCAFETFALVAIVVLGAFVGARLEKNLQAASLKRGFAWLLTSVGSALLIVSFYHGFL